MMCFGLMTGVGSSSGPGVVRRRADRRRAGAASGIGIASMALSSAVSGSSCSAGAVPVRAADRPSASSIIVLKASAMRWLPDRKMSPSWSSASNTAAVNAG